MTNHLPIRQRLKHVQPRWTIKHRRLCTVWENSSKKSSSGADNLVQRLTERIMNPRVGGGPQAIKVISSFFLTQIIEVHLHYEMDSSSIIQSPKTIILCQVMLAHLPLTLVCLDGLGNLSEKHPVMAQQAVSCLRYLSLVLISCSWFFCTGTSWSTQATSWLSCIAAVKRRQGSIIQRSKVWHQFVFTLHVEWGMKTH